ncbi:PrpF protein-domain-containing protein [Xylariaceae sp. FL0255]|nr:PrpF protein-domain-containing protein [Xylariaceae sp. FL0255]
MILLVPRLRPRHHLLPLSSTSSGLILPSRNLGRLHLPTRAPLTTRRLGGNYSQYLSSWHTGARFCLFHLHQQPVPAWPGASLISYHSSEGLSTTTTITISTASKMSLDTAPKGQRPLPALFVRSGTSNGLVLRASDLPPDEAEWEHILPAAMGSPDPRHVRQLDGMGGGSSSTSKVCVLAPSERNDADVDFKFVQVGIKDGKLDLAGNCGNMSAIMGPIAWDWGWVENANERIKVVEGQETDEAGAPYREALVRIFNNNTSKIVHSRFRVHGDPPRYCPVGSYVMDGVPDTQSRITLSFINPGGAKTGRALPTGNAVDTVKLESGPSVRVSLVDVSNPGVFVSLEDLKNESAEFGLSIKRPITAASVEADDDLKKVLDEIRRAGASAMSLDPNVESVPKVVMVWSPPQDDGMSADIECQAMSMGQAHKAVPLTLSLCLGTATNMEGTIPAQVRRMRKTTRTKAENSSSSVIIKHPSGYVEIGATFKDGEIVSAELHRTARVLMKGEVYY